jgi:hypothetical protein
MAHFVEQRKQRIAHDEFQPIEALLFGEVFEARIVLERTRKLLDALVKGLRRSRPSRWRPLPQNRATGDQ